MCKTPSRVPSSFLKYGTTSPFWKGVAHRTEHTYDPFGISAFSPRSGSTRGCPKIPSMSTVSIVGVPSSAGSYAAGQDQAPAALRLAGLIGALSAVGLEVHDEGDLPLQVWRPDVMILRAQNVDQVTECVGNVIACLVPLLSSDQTLLVLDGNCTIAFGVVAALRRLAADPVGLLYVDRHYDMNTPQSTTDGALDWMGMAHARDLPGCLDVLTDVLGTRLL
jgi:arginase